MNKLRYQYAAQLLCEKIKIKLVHAKYNIQSFFTFRPIFLTFSILLVSAVAITGLAKFKFGQDIGLVAPGTHEDFQYWGQLGDFLGGVLNPCLSFMALIAVLHSIKIQSKELSEAQKETKIANRLQSQQTALFERQNFESTFFRLLDVHARIVQNLQYEAAIGHNAFEVISRELHNVCARTCKSENERHFNQYRHYTPLLNSIIIPPEVQLQNYMKDAEVKSVDFAIRHSSTMVLGHQGDGPLALYFRNMYQLLKLIENARFDNPSDEQRSKRMSIRALRLDYYQKRQYANILRAQLSQPELEALIFNCASDSGAGLKAYVEKYSLLKHRRPWGNISVQVCARHFDDIAFADYEDISDTKIREYAHQRIQRSLRHIYSNHGSQ